MSDTRLRIGLVGTGDFGPELARYIREIADLVAICDPSESARAKCNERLGLNLPAFDHHERMLDEVPMDAVAICSPNFTHREATVAAAERGKHVFCEKAMAPTVPDCWTMVRACEKNNVRLMVGHKRRLRPPWARLIELRDKLGDPVAMTTCCYHDARSYNFFDMWWNNRELSGGILPVIGVHVIDWMRGMAGDVATVRGLAAPKVDPRWTFSDSLHTEFTFTSGAVASLTVSLSYPVWKFRQSSGPLVVCREGGMRLEPHLDHIDVQWQHRDEDELHRERFDDLGFDHAYRQEVGDFVRWVTEGTTPCLTWKEGLRCVELMEAAHRSADRGGEVIELPLYPELEQGTL